jgi:2-polyprenyl-3-methyl-5-hydroxy-6-metoxy-1,4-benzoquinol methylase
LIVKNHIEHYKVDAELFNYFETGNKLENDYNNRIHQLILKSLPADYTRLLDIGSGGGWLLKNTSKHSITLVDLSFKNLSAIRAECPQKGGLFIISDAHELPFKNERFDVIIISEVLEHLNKPEIAIKSAFRILRKNGKIIITTPYDEQIRYYLCIHCNQKTPANAHLHSFNEKNLSDILDRIGIKNFGFSKMGNKYFLKSRLSYLLSYLPFFIWKIIDKMFIFLFGDPLTLVLTIEKED